MDLLESAANSDTDKRVVRLPQEFELQNAHHVWARLHDAIDWNSVLLLDMSRCEFIDSTAAGVILRAARELRQRQSRLGIVGLRDQPLAMFERSALVQAPNLLVYDDEDEARDALGIVGVAHGASRRGGR